MVNASLSAITERFQACALDLGQWESGLDDIVHSFDVAGAVLLSSDTRFSQPINSQRMHDSTSDYMRNGWNLRDERWRVRPKILMVGLATEDDAMSEAERAVSPYYQEFLKSHGLGYFVCVGFHAGDDVWAISIQRHYGQPGFSPEQVATFHQLWRPLSDAATLSRQVSFARVLGATDAYEHMRQPAIALTSDLRLIAHNDRAAPCGAACSMRRRANSASRTRATTRRSAPSSDGCGPERCRPPPQPLRRWRTAAGAASRSGSSS